MTEPAAPTPPLPSDETVRTATPRARAPQAGVGASAAETVSADSRVGAPPPNPRDAEGAPFGRYRLLEEVGRGGMGVVWRAWDTTLQRTVALKQILAEELASAEQIARLLQEARVAAKLHHPNIVTVYDVGEEGGRHYLTAEYVEGRPLSRMKERPPAKQALAWVRQVAEALAYAHAQGVVHRDVKPANILIDAQGNAFISDFGLAREMDPAKAAAVTATGSIVGTPLYMSPEQARAERPGPAADQFSLGTVLYEILTGRTPFDATSLRDLLDAIEEADPARPRSIDPALPRDVETICLKALEKSPSQRYASMSDFAADLAKAIAGEPVSAVPVSSLARLLRHAWRHRATILPITAAVAVALGVVGWWRREAAAIRAEQKQMGEALTGAGRLLDEARPQLDRATRLLYEEDSTFEELARRVGEAEKVLRQARARAPDLAVVHHLAGRARLLLGDDVGAFEEFARALEIDPAFAPARFERAKIRFVWGYVAELPTAGAEAIVNKEKTGQMFEGAAADLREIRPSAGTAPSEEWALALEEVAALDARLDGDLDRTIRLCRDAIEKYPRADGREEFHFLLGSTLGGEEGIAELSRAIEIRPKHAVARYARGTMRLDRGELREAIADLDVAIEFAPRFALAWTRRGIAFGRLDRWKEAREDLDRAVEAEPNLYAARVNRAICRWYQKDLDGAREDFDAAVERWPQVGALRMHRAAVRAELGEEESEVITDAEEGEGIDPEAARLWVEVAKAFDRGGRLDAAMRACVRGLSAVPDAIELLFERGRLHLVQGRDVEAEEDFQAVLSKERTNAQALYHLGCVHAVRAGRDGADAAKERDRAFELLDEAIDQGMRDHEVVVSDEDLRSLHDDPRWKDVLKRVEKE